MGIQEDGLGTEGQPTPDTAAGLLADLDAAHDEAGRDRRPLADAAPQPAAPLAVPEPAVAAAAADRPAQSAAAAKAGGVSWGEMPPSPSEELPPDTPTTAKSDAGSEASSGAASSISPHYDDKRDVILKMEHLGEKEIKSMILGVWGTLLVGVALLGVVLWIKLSTDKQDYLQNSVVPSVNVAFASALVAGMATCWVLYARRVARAVASGKRWSARRLRAVQLTSAEVSLQLVNSIFFLVPNGYVLSHDCAWFNPLVHWSGWVRWTCWNTLFLLFWVQGSSTSPLKGRAAERIGRPDGMLMDGPLWLHWKKLWLWGAMEAALTWLTVYLATADWTPPGYDPGLPDCRDEPWSCHFPTTPLVLVIVNAACLIAYAALYLRELRLAYRRLAARPYTSFRMGNLVVRLQARLRILAICFFVASSVIYTFVGINTCASYLTSWLGYLPMQLVMSAVAVANARIFMPKRPHDTAILQVWLQEARRRIHCLRRLFAPIVCTSPALLVWSGLGLALQLGAMRHAPWRPGAPAPRRPGAPPPRAPRAPPPPQFAWTERDVPRKREERSSSLPPESLESFCMDCEPMFCLETGIKMMYWSYLVYDHREVDERGSPFSVDTALSLYDLESFELLWERSLDTKCIFGWNSDTVVIAFRGTASLANVKADVQLWRTPYPEGVGRLLLGTAPLVHAGFKAAYTANGFNQRLLERLRHILFRCAEAQTEAGSEKPVTVYVTGHSLGGALATLCAYDIRTHCPCAEYLVNVKVYTFGAPRTGNHAFARLYNERVPDTWHVINNDDAVCRGGKFLVLYKRPGHRVLVNKLGDLVVRPSYVETFIRKLPGAGSVRDHLLTSYQRALTAVLAAQFGSKMVDGGREGALQLAQEAGTREVLADAGLPFEDIQMLERLGLAAFKRERRSSKKERKGSSRRRLGSALLHLGSRKASGASPEPSKDLEEVVVADGAGGGKEAPGLGQQAPPQAAMQPEVRHEAPRPEQQPAAQAAAEQQPAAQAAAGQQQPAAGQKAGEAPPGEALPPSFTHERQLRVRQCGARRQCRTMCQVLARRAHARGGAGGGGAPPPKGLSPMCDIPTEREELRSAQQAGEGLPRMSGAAVLGLEPSPSGEAQPEHEGTARGRVASFPLILSPAPSSPLGGR